MSISFLLSSFLFLSYSTTMFDALTEKKKRKNRNSDNSDDNDNDNNKKKTIIEIAYFKCLHFD